MSATLITPGWQQIAEQPTAVTTSWVSAVEVNDWRRLHLEVEKLLKQHRFTEDDRFCIRLALEEALANAIKHGHANDQAKPVAVAYWVQENTFYIRVTDAGPGFDPEHIPDPRLCALRETPSGRGLLMMKHYMNHVAFNESGNSVLMKRVKGAG